MDEPNSAAHTLFTYVCLLCLLELSPPLDGATLAGVDFSAFENWIKICIRIVTAAKQIAEKVMPFHEERIEDRWKTFHAPKISSRAQEHTTCYCKQETGYIYSLARERKSKGRGITKRDFTGRPVSCRVSPKEPSAICLSNNLSCFENHIMKGWSMDFLQDILWKNGKSQTVSQYKWAP